ncbi:MAG: Ni/Fe hydrogenase subunit alpha [Planctomycetes bacterium]|nr:Ni/Fe hydrogenase subunit alpha [Planctomycetota bacterium]
MARKITIEPVTRIEGHAKVTIHLDDAGNVEAARFHVIEFRGFEKFCEGRHMAEMPALTSRICGICPVSHQLASVKACDQIIGVDPPRPARLLRELMHMGQIVQSHALSFFHLSSPDFLLGFDADPAIRNVVGLMAKDPELARKGIRLRQYGQDVIQAVGGRKIHSDVCVPGGMNKPLAAQARDDLRARLPEAFATARLAYELAMDLATKNADLFRTFAVTPMLSMGLVDGRGRLEHYHGGLRFKDAGGKILEDQVDANAYLSVIAEATEDYSYLKFPFYRPLGYPDGSYRVGPLARLTVADAIETEEAARLWKDVVAHAGRQPVEGALWYHVARTVEIVFGLERILILLEDPDILSSDTVAPPGERRPEAVGVLEAPRGTLFHHYVVDETDAIVRANLIVATGQNNMCMNRGVEEVARAFVSGDGVTEGALNRVEAAIRAYDPCLSCSTHAIGRMPLAVEIVDRAGRLVERIARGV